MNIKSFLFSALFLIAGGLCAFAQKYQPAETYKYATKDGQDLYFDYYAPAPGSIRTIDGHEKPTILFVFGGGFMEGSRNEDGYLDWFEMLSKEGYPLISIDYRLGLKDVKLKKGAESVKQFRHSAQIAAEDVFSAVRYILDYGSSFGVDGNNLVVSGSSAGAIAALEADWLLCNGKATESFPDGFRFAGVMPFAGAIITMEGKPGYKNVPAPTAFFHGTGDKVVNYKKIHLFKWGIFGSDALARIFRKNGYTYSIFRYTDHTHEIANAMEHTFPEQLRFLETVVTKGIAMNMDAVIEDPRIPAPSGSRNRKELYGDSK